MNGMKSSDFLRTHQLVASREKARMPRPEEWGSEMAFSLEEPPAEAGGFFTASDICSHWDGPFAKLS